MSNEWVRVRLKNNIARTAAVAANEVWAVGWYRHSESYRILPLIERWNGNSWSVVSVPSVSPQDHLNPLDALPATHLWAGGWLMPSVSLNSEAVFYQHSDPCGGQMPTATVTATATAPATATATPTATAPPTPRALVGIVTWPGRPAQPHRPTSSRSR